MIKTKKKIVLFSPSIEDGGVEKNLYYISSYLVKKFKNVSVVTANWDKRNNFSKKINFISLSTNLFKNSSRTLKSIICFFLLLKIRIRFKKIVILSFNNNIFAILIAKLIGASVIIRSNTSIKSYIHNKVKKKIFSFIFNLADDVIVNSLDMVREMKTFLNIRSIHIYNPIEKIKILKTKAKSKQIKKYFNNTELKILTIGRIVEQKNHMLILKSLNLIKTKIKFKLIIIGDGEEKTNIIKFIKDNNLQKNVEIINYQKNIYKFLKIIDLFILSSNYEGLPNVLLEALAFKKVIFSTNCPTGPREILNNGKFGTLFPVNNYKKLSNLILNYYNNKTIYQQKAISGFKSLNRFSPEKNCQKYLSVIKKYQ